MHGLGVALLRDGRSRYLGRHILLVVCGASMTPTPDTEEYWRNLRRRWEINKMIERVLWVLLGFVIGALAMYAGFPK